jgi:aspartyl protease family protein
MSRAALTSAFWFWVILAAVLTPGFAAASTVDALNEAGKSAYGRGQYATAADLFAQAIARDPKEPLFHYHRAVALTQLQRWREARAAYLAAQELNPPAPLAALVRHGLRALAPMDRSARSGDGESVSVALWPFRGIWLAEAMINDQRSARFVVDTGATLCVLSPVLAESLGIEPEPDAPVVELQTLNGRASGRLVSIPALRVGEAEAKAVAAVILLIGPEVDGILGNSFLARFAVTLDSERGVLHLRPRRFRQEPIGRK